MNSSNKKLLIDLATAISFIIIISVLLFLYKEARGDHWQSETKEWRSDYRGRNGGLCCGEEDCWISHNRIISQGKDTAIVEIDGLIVRDFPIEYIHASQDGNDYACIPYQNSEFGFSLYKADGSGGICNKNTKDPACINCVFINVGS